MTTLTPNHIDVSGAEIVGHTTSDRPGVRQWTELGIYFLPAPDGRCFVARVEGCSRVEGQTTRRRGVYVGTLDRALEFFDDGDLKDALVIQARDWEDRNPGRAEDAVRKLRAAEKERQQLGAAPQGFTGEGGLAGALRWLYGDGTAGGWSEDLDRDFGVPSRTVRYALDQESEGKGLTGWAKGFVSALLFFDRAAFLAARPREAR